MIKRILGLIWILITGFAGFSQPEFAPIGAQWWYSYLIYNDSSGEGKIIPFYMESVGDTVIKNKNCRILQVFIDTTICYGLYGYDDTLYYVYSDSNKVYYYNQFADTFYLLYNFNANPGDSWDIYMDSSCSQHILIDSVNIINVNGNLLRELYYQPPPLFDAYNFKIIERIGFYIGFLIPDYNLTCNYIDSCIDFSSFRCYIDSIIEEFHHQLWTEINCADTLVGYVYLPEIQFKKNKFIIYPNPTNNIVTVKSAEPLQKPFEIELYNYFGIVVLRKKNIDLEITINMSSLLNGIYYLKLKTYETNNIYKLVKE